MWGAAPIHFAIARQIMRTTIGFIDPFPMIVATPHNFLKEIKMTNPYNEKWKRLTVLERTISNLEQRKTAKLKSIHRLENEIKEIEETVATLKINKKETSKGTLYGN